MNIENLREAVRGQAGWLKFLAVLNIIAGVLYIWALVGVIPLVMGILMWQMGSRAGDFQASANEYALHEYLRKATTYWKVSGIMTIIGVGLSILMACVYVVFIAAIFGSQQ